MAIRIIRDDERLTITIAGGVFTYRRISTDMRARLVEQHTNKRSGNVNWGKATIEILRHCLLDWSGVVDEHGKAIPFDAALIPYLPDTVQTELMEAFGENADLEADIKNSPTTPSSNPSTEG